MVDTPFTMKHTLSPGHLSPARAMRSHVGESAMQDASAEHRTSTRYGERWVRSLAPIGVAARVPFLGIVGAPVAAGALAGITVSAFLAMEGETYSAALRLATVAARRGRLCGGRGRRAAWGTATDAGGIVALPVPRDSGDDDEAATDAVGVVWARAKAGRYGAVGDPMPIGVLYGTARNLGRLRAVRRIRESAPLVGLSTDRAIPVYSEHDAPTREQILAQCPAHRRAALARSLDASGESKHRRYRLPAEDRTASRIALLAQKGETFDAIVP